MNSNEIIDLLDPPEDKIRFIGNGVSVQYIMDEYMKTTQHKITEAMKVDLLNIYRNEHGQHNNC